MIRTKRFAGNSIALLINRLTQSISTFVLVSAISRLEGTYELGQYLLAFSYYFVITSFTANGLKNLMIREISRKPATAALYLGNGTFLQICFSGIGYLILVALVSVLPYDPETSRVCYVLGLMTIPFSLWNVTEAVFQSRDRMYLITLSTVPIYVLRLVASIWLLQHGYGVIAVCFTLVLSEVLVLLLQWLFVLRLAKPEWKINWQFLRTNIQLVKTFLALDGVAILSSRIQLVLLSLLAGEVAVGLYGGMVQLIQPFEIISSSIIGAMMPSIMRTAEIDKMKQKQATEILISILLCAALPFVLGIFLWGSDLLVFVYSDLEFSQVSTAFNIVSLRAILIGLGSPVAIVLVANGLEEINLKSSTYSFFIGSILGIILIPFYQLSGAAISSLGIIWGTSRNLFNLYSKIYSLNIGNILYYPSIITILMCGIFLFLPLTPISFLARLVTAIIVYTIIVSLLGIYIKKRKSVF